MNTVNNSVNRTDFNRIAPYYDFLQKIVFGNQLLHSQTHFLNKIPSSSNVLIVGGGSGKILKPLFTHSKPNKVVYLEKSVRMIELAKSNNQTYSNVDFVCGDVLEWNDTPQQFDVILLPFILDVFNNSDVTHILKKLHDSLEENGLVIFTDFVNHGQNQIPSNLLLRTMYLFFKITAKLNTDHLPDVDSAFKKTGFKLGQAQPFKAGMIESRVYRKSNS